jgi:thiamine-phosphate pyrophosphorylase
MAQLYAIVGTLSRARWMLEAGVPYLQLRCKDRPLAPHRDEIAAWPARYPATRLIVNDDLEFALSVGAWGVHLGQEDLLRYAPAQLRQAPLKVGISTHDDAEIRIAQEWGAAMIGFGPIFPTGTKAVTHGPQGIARLREVVQKVPLPVIAIGGIGAENAREVADTGVAMIAMISALDKIESAEALRELMEGIQ